MDFTPIVNPPNESIYDTDVFWEEQSHRWEFEKIPLRAPKIFRETKNNERKRSYDEDDSMDYLSHLFNKISTVKPSPIMKSKITAKSKLDEIREEVLFVDE